MWVDASFASVWLPFFVFLYRTSSWMKAGLKLKSNEARDTSTIHCLVTADVPLNPSATKQWYYITNSANRAGQWLQVQYWFHLTFQRLNDKAIYCTVRIVSLRQMTLLQSIIFIYPITPKIVSPPFKERKKAGEQAWNSLVYAYLNLEPRFKGKKQNHISHLIRGRSRVRINARAFLLVSTWVLSRYSASSHRPKICMLS